MIKVLSAKQTKELDAFTIKEEGIASIDLMERACRAFIIWFTEHFNATQKIGVVCGTGNNGGDGLGIARMLLDWGYPVKVWIVRGAVPESTDFKINFERLRDKKIQLLEISTEADQGLFTDRDVLIDAIFGSGLSRAPEGIYAQAIRCINKLKATRVAIDLPSGLRADSPSENNIVEAHHTISFQLPKLSFFFPQYHQYVGEWVLVDIGLNKSFIKNSETSYFLTARKSVKKILQPRTTFDHKGKFGHALLVTGGFGKMGAAVLSSRAALHSGLGLLTAHVPGCGYGIIQTAVPEAMVQVDENDWYATVIKDTDKFDTIGIGPGLGQQKETVKAFASLLEVFKKPMVIDADALNMLSANRELLHLVPQGSILTPHPKEFERLVGVWKNDFERLEKQKALAKELKCVIVLKGAYSSIASHEGEVFFNSTGNPGMAKGGSGDVLTGVLTALLAQRYGAMQAAIMGVYLHGFAGDLAAVDKGVYSMTASDLIFYIPQAFKELAR